MYVCANTPGKEGNCEWEAEAIIKSAPESQQKTRAQHKRGSSPTAQPVATPTCAAQNNHRLMIISPFRHTLENSCKLSLAHNMNLKIIVYV